MRIVCPNCAAAYEVPTSRLKPGRSVRCARCGNRWTPDPDAPAAEAGVAEVNAAVPEQQTQHRPPPFGAPIDDQVAAPSPPEMTAMDRLAAARAAPQPARAGLIGAWIFTFVVLAAAVAATIDWRDALIRTWPPSGHILAASGRMSPESAQSIGKKPE